ncbi:MAG TPA: DnaJ domain-containing protein [Gemmatimonadaceae bacterium]|nr:DnaJ domain-containing protein [Gemmatimonadaceae bacterium]
MPQTCEADYYEVLQVSPRADRETIERVFRHLAHRYHPDNLESGNADRFSELVNAYGVLSDAGRRAQYDVQYEEQRQQRWRIFNQESSSSQVAVDTRIRLSVLTLLYMARRNEPAEPGIGNVEIERILGCPSATLEFHLWYLRESGWVTRLQSGHMAITASGVDKFFDLGGPPQRGPHLLQTGDVVSSLVEGAA